jgi:hypothetical protein
VPHIFLVAVPRHFTCFPGTASTSSPKQRSLHGRADAQHVVAPKSFEVRHHRSSCGNNPVRSTNRGIPTCSSRRGYEHAQLQRRFTPGRSHRRPIPHSATRACARTGHRRPLRPQTRQGARRRSTLVGPGLLGLGLRRLGGCSRCRVSHGQSAHRRIPDRKRRSAVLVFGSYVGTLGSCQSLYRSSARCAAHSRTAQHSLAGPCQSGR